MFIFRTDRTGDARSLEIDGKIKETVKELESMRKIHRNNGESLCGKMWR